MIGGCKRSWQGSNANSWTKQVKPVLACMPVVLWACVIIVLTVLPLMVILSLLPFDREPMIQVISRFAVLAHLRHAVEWDKWAHFFLYAVLGTLTVVSFYFAGIRSVLRNVTFSFIVGTGYGIVTEIIQTFCPTRTASLHDACANIIGVAAGIILGNLVIGFDRKKGPDIDIPYFQ